MSDKAARKRELILCTAKEIFKEKGFKAVTMKDIAEACEISRGGLYLYFDSTESILKECLDDESFGKRNTDEAPGDALVRFLNEEKKSILGEEDSLLSALYEYLFFAPEDSDIRKTVQKRYEEKFSYVKSLLDAGAESGELYCDDSELAAKNILYTLDGLRINKKTIGISEADVDQTLLYTLSGFIVDEEA